ncbi:MAG: hypothetical protein ACRYHA_31705, partial [Janthinobacterium lividum]
ADGSLGVESVADIDARLAAEEAAAARDPDMIALGAAGTPGAPEVKAANGRARADGERPNPFAALAGLRGKLPPDDDKKS